MIQKLFGSLFTQKREDRKVDLHRNLIRREAQIGGQLFGPIPEGHRREFFCLDERTWIWHEEWTDTQGVQHAKTTRYDVKPEGILKAQDGQPYQLVGPDEIKNLYEASKLYRERVRREIYNYI